MITFILTSFIHFYSFAMQFDQMHDFNSVVCILLSPKFDKTEAIMLVGDFVSW